MITAVIQIGRQTAAIELPQDRFSLQYWLAQMGMCIFMTGWTAKRKHGRD